MRHTALAITLLALSMSTSARAATEWIPPEDRTTPQLKRFVAMYERQIALAQKRIDDLKRVSHELFRLVSIRPTDDPKLRPPDDAHARYAYYREYYPEQERKVAVHMASSSSKAVAKLQNKPMRIETRTELVLNAEQAAIDEYAWKLQAAQAELGKRGESTEGFLSPRQIQQKIWDVRAAALRKGNVLRRIARQKSTSR